MGARRRARHRRPLQPRRLAVGGESRARCSSGSSTSSPSWACGRSWARSWSSTFSSPTRRTRNGWRRYGEGTGNVYVSGLKGDPENTLLASLRQLAAYDIDVVAANHEFSSGQFEINLWHSEALDAADRAFRLKTAVQELARRNGRMATFMAKPFNDEGGSGFHIHFSTLDDDGKPLFDDPDGEDGLSDIARSAIAGVLAHAPALAADPAIQPSTPTSGSAPTRWRPG